MKRQIMVISNSEPSNGFSTFAIEASSFKTYFLSDTSI